MHGGQCDVLETVKAIRYTNDACVVKSAEPADLNRSLRTVSLL